MDAFTNKSQGYLQQAEKFLHSEQGQKLENQFEQKTGIDIEKYLPNTSGAQSFSSGNSSTVQPTSGRDENNQNADGNYAGNYAQDESTTEGGYGGDPFSRSNQMGGASSGREGQFGRSAAGDEQASDSYGSGNKSGSGSEYGGSQPGGTGFEMTTGQGTQGYEGDAQQGRNQSFRGQSSDEVGA